MASGLVARGLGREVPLSRGLLASFSRGVEDQLANVKPSDWFGPSQPFPRVAPSTVRARIRDYPPFINIQYMPKAYEGSPFDVIRGAADGLPLVRCAIETVKDLAAGVDGSWTVRPLDEDEPPSKIEERQKSDKGITKLTQFFRKPDGLHSYNDWRRMLWEEMLVPDATSICPRWTMDGKLAAFDIIDGGTIHVVVDEFGRSPEAPQCAYQQILHGVPAVNLMRAVSQYPKSDQLFYFPRNIRTHRLYGYSPTEQILLVISLAIRRLMYQLFYYTEGTMPDVALELPEGASIDQLEKYEAMYAEVFTAMENRRKMKFIPHGTKPHQFKDINLFDAMDEWLARQVAYCFSVPVTALVKQVNRASSQQMTEDTKAEGLQPKLAWEKQVMDELAAFIIGDDHIEWTYGQITKENPLQQAQIAQIYLSTVDSEGHSVVLANEVREDLGKEAIDWDELDQQKIANAQQMMEATTPQNDGNGGNNAEQDAQRRQQQTDRADSPSVKSVSKAVMKSVRIQNRRRALKKKSKQARIHRAMSRRWNALKGY